ncbi:hypothetical protein Poli38472_008395 [Pythium oligandrum]|uniref:Uncharacterized protein n=1 Tax=Pythium oligandrum TaxID=41045 RepID=A0A8K1CNZ3_PYTOL|nr:hypothetical protein Poli38472_008395 [Pythium oligandrum]|eukprot:TMW65753.1 hypothetical protein Poli38472_008395 [Pythium oligandrum]
MADDERGCWQKKAAYDQCFDQWYKDVFLQHKAKGQVGCQQEYKAYSECFLKELDTEKSLVESIKSVMASDVRKRWEAEEDKRKSKN